MEYINSYIVLRDFRKALLRDRLASASYTSVYEDAMPFRSFSEKNWSAIYQALKNDLFSIGIMDVDLNGKVFFSSEESADSAAICYVYVSIRFYNQHIKVTFEYLFSQGIIYCYFYGIISKEILDRLTCSDNKFIKTLAQNYNSGEVSQFWDFFKS
jgi:hypothetical protein